MKFSIFNQNQFDGIDTNDYVYKKLSTLDKAKVYKIDGLFINSTSKFGAQPILIISEIKALVNLPSYLVQTAQTILSDVEAIDTIKQGKVGFRVKEYTKNHKNCFTIVFVDL